MQQWVYANARPGTVNHGDWRKRRARALFRLYAIFVLDLKIVRWEAPPRP